MPRIVIDSRVARQPHVDSSLPDHGSRGFVREFSDWRGPGIGMASPTEAAWGALVGDLVLRAGIWRLAMQQTRVGADATPHFARLVFPCPSVWLSGLIPQDSDLPGYCLVFAASVRGGDSLVLRRFGWSASPPNSLDMVVSARSGQVCLWWRDPGRFECPSPLDPDEATIRLWYVPFATRHGAGQM